MVSIRLLLVCVALIFNSGVVDAKLYKWVDENGVTHFSNTAPPQDETEVHTKGEVKSSGPDPSHSPGIEKVLKSYKQDQLRDKADDIEKRKNRRQKSSSSSMAGYYEKQLKKEKIELESRKQKLKDVQRESYSDQQAHREKVRYYEDRVRRSELEIERYQLKLDDARNDR